MAQPLLSQGVLDQMINNSSYLGFKPLTLAKRKGGRKAKINGTSITVHMADFKYWYEYFLSFFCCCCNWQLQFGYIKLSLVTNKSHSPSHSPRKVWNNSFLITENMVLWLQQLGHSVKTSTKYTDWRTTREHFQVEMRRDWRWWQIVPKFLCNLAGIYKIEFIK